MLKRRGFGLLIGTALAVSAGEAAPQDYPARPVTVVVPFAPGGGTDVIARTVTAKMAERLGRQFVVENKPGAAGAVGAQYVAKAKPDGHTLLLWNSAFVMSAFLSQQPYDNFKDFEPVGRVAGSPAIISVNPNLPAKTLAEVIALAKAKPGEINYGTSGQGSSDHLAVELFQQVAGLRMTHVPYKGGAPASVAAVAGEVQMVGLTPGTVTGQIKAGQLRAPAVSSERRLSTLPEIPTSAEAGLPEYVVETWYGIWAPAGTPEPLIAKLNEALQAAVASEDVKKVADRCWRRGGRLLTEDFAAIVRRESDRWGKIIKAANIKME